MTTPCLPPAFLARVELLATLLAAPGYQITLLPDEAHTLSPCRRGPVVAHVTLGGQLVGGIVQIGERLAPVVAQHPAAPQFVAAVHGAWASAEWEGRFGPSVHIPSPQPWHANLSPQARQYLREIGAPDPDSSPEHAALVWRHALAIGYSPAYLSENAQALAGDWPRVPLPAALDVLLASAALGRRVAELLDDAAAPTDEVPAGVGALQGADGEQGYELRGGWGHRQGDKVMPGRGTVGLGDTVTIGLNRHWAWGGVPLAVWEFRVGGYQVLKKWLSYREFDVLGRALTPEEVQEFCGIIRRLAALVQLQPALDANYQRCRSNTWNWKAEAPAPPAPPSRAVPTPPPPFLRPSVPAAEVEAARRDVQGLMEARRIIVIPGAGMKGLDSAAGAALRRLEQALSPE